MNHPPRPRLKSPPEHPGPPSAARPASRQAAVGAPKGVARQGVLSACRPDPHVSADPTPYRPGIRISAPPVYRHHYDGARWSTRCASTPTAAYACACGKSATATGAEAVAELVDAYAYHRSICTGTPAAPAAEGRAAA
ncbi:hypothetical protein GCM10010394_49960 [Streptomyces crystallinus]|uniref:Uncharacterized protein n=1 Tax=Streptomyces crystallinus TaxID=68191 RepID=A0ABP3RNK2_9ACTN